MKSAALLLSLGLCAAGAATVEINVPGLNAWTDTGIDLRRGDAIKIKATGTVQFANSQPAGPAGLPRGWRDLLRTFTLNDVGRGALIGRIAKGDLGGRPFLVGAEHFGQAATDGRLYLIINQSGEQPQGSFKVTIEHIPSAAVVTQAPSGPPPDRLTQEQLNSVPRRVVDAEGTEGDRTNFILVGSEREVTGALQSAGWVVVDRSTKDSVLKGILGTFAKEAYLTMPMSELMVFGRAQDYGYAQGDPVRVVMARHHFRIWKAPFKVGRRDVWVGAGTHDVGFDKDQRNGKITHRIDPKTDGERDYIGKSLEGAGRVLWKEYLTPKDPVLKAKTAHGQEFESDGRTLILYLREDSADMSTRFADLFCSVLAQSNPDSGEWGACGDWIEKPGRTDLKFGPLPKDFRVLLVGGFMSTCSGAGLAFDDVADRLGMDVMRLRMPNNGSRENARLIAQVLREQTAADTRPIIAITYSKGTPDMQEALVYEPDVAKRVVAQFSIAGAAGGSPLAELLPESLGGYLQYSNKVECQGDTAQGLNSLKRSVRRAFQASFPVPVIPVYSLAAVADPSRLSSKLAKAAVVLAKFDPRHDGQLTVDDALVSGSRFAGVVKSDHLGIALAGGEKFPRAALLESVVRLVIEDLGKPKSGSQ